MSRVFLNSIDLQKNELQNAKVQNLAAAPASPVAGQLYYDTTANTLYFYNGSGWVSAAGLSLGGAPATTEAIGQAAAAGTATTVSRSDHVHPMAAAGAPAASAPGDAQTTGSATTFAASDHKHAREAFATNTIALGTAAAAGVASTLIRSDATIAAFDATAPAASAVGDAAATGSAAVAARRDHKHAREAFAAPTAETAFGTSSATGSATTVAHSDHTHGNPTHVGTDHSAIVLNNLAAATGNYSMGGNLINNVGTPVAATDAANKAYVDASATGLDVKASVRVATTAAIAGATYTATAGTSGRGQFTTMPNTIDGVTLNAGDRVLVKNQATGAQNGIYTVTTVGTGANGVWDRATDFDQDAEVTAGAFTFVAEGTTNADTGWVLTTNDPITVGGASGTALTFAQFSGAGTYQAGNGLTLTGTTFAVGAGTGIAVSAGTTAVDTTVVTRKYQTAVGDGVSTSIVVTHNLNNSYPFVQLWETSGSKRLVECDVQATSANSVTLLFATAPASGAYEAVVAA